jgi:hypothetical protein
MADARWPMAGGRWSMADDLFHRSVIGHQASAIE